MIQSKIGTLIFNPKSVFDEFESFFDGKKEKKSDIADKFKSAEKEIFDILNAENISQVLNDGVEDEKTIFGIDTSELMGDDELMRWKLQFLFDEINYERKGGR